MAKTSPTQRTLALLRKDGYSACVAEKYNSFIHRRFDLFGIIDVAAIKATESGVLGVQATSASHITDRIKKSLALPVLKIWLQAGNKFEVWGWSKKGARGKRKLWTVDRRIITLSSCNGRK